MATYIKAHFQSMPSSTSLLSATSFPHILAHCLLFRDGYRAVASRDPTKTSWWLGLNPSLAHFSFTSSTLLSMSSVDMLSLDSVVSNAASNTSATHSESSWFMLWLAPQTGLVFG